MRTTLNINDDLLKQAARLSGYQGEDCCGSRRIGKALVARESAKAGALGGSQPRLRKIRRRRPQASMASR